MKRTSLFLFSIFFLSSPSMAANFSAIVSPPRFEDSVKSGSVYKNVIEMTNASDKSIQYNIKTNDWSFSPTYDLLFQDHLAENSCRPWVILESNSVVIAPGATKKFRFQVEIPENAPVSECKFVMLIEGNEPFVSQSTLAVPVSGRVGVITYLAINGAKPQLELQSVTTITQDNQTVPAIVVRNTGQAHGRLEGFIDAIDAKGQKIQLAPTSLPILSGEERLVALQPQPKSENEPIPTLLFPIQLNGKVNWGNGNITIKQTVTK